MNIVSYPVLLTFVIIALILFVVSLFIGKWGYLTSGVGIVLIALYTINAFLLGFSYLEIVVTLLILVVIFMICLLVKEKKR